MKGFWNIFAALCVVVGIVWMLQGVNLLKGSVMSGHGQWIPIGAVLLGAGVAVYLVNNRKRNGD